jgi:hypothetical protein
MSGFERSIEQQIQRARREGKFDNLEGQGKPIKLNDNPYEDPDKKIANHVLKSNGFAPLWIQLSKSIDSRLKKARSDLHRQWDWYQNKRQANRNLDWTESEWQKYLDRFRAEINDINGLITSYNVQVPNPRFERIRLDPEIEIHRAKQPE